MSDLDCPSCRGVGETSKGVCTMCGGKGGSIDPEEYLRALQEIVRLAEHSLSSENRRTFQREARMVLSRMQAPGWTWVEEGRTYSAESDENIRLWIWPTASGFLANVRLGRGGKRLRKQVKTLDEGKAWCEEMAQKGPTSPST